MSLHSGCNHILYLSEGKLFGFGWNSSFALSGSPMREKRVDPVEIKIPGNPRILKFTNGINSLTTVVLTTKGLYGCGDGEEGEFGDGEENRHISFRREMHLINFYRKKSQDVENYFCEGGALWVLLKNNKIYRGGCNNFGQLSNGKTSHVRVPEKLDQSFLPSDPYRGKVIDIKVFNHTLLLTDRGGVYFCGNGDCGQGGMRGNRVKFQRIKFFEKIQDKVNIVAVGAGMSHSLFLSATGSCYSTGSNEYGQIGQNEVQGFLQEPDIIDGLKNVNVAKICCAELFSLFLTTKNVVFGCGRNNCGQMTRGLGGSKKTCHVPTRISSSLRFIDIATTFDSSTFLTASGDVYSVGKNSEGQCGVIGGDDKDSSSFSNAIYKLTKTNFTIKVILIQPTLFKEKPPKLTDTILIVGT